METTEIIFEGVTYKRNPDAEHRSNRVYFAAPRGSGRGMYHRDLYISLHGPIPDGWIVHHIDHDPLNNDPSNLAAINRKAHAAEHSDDINWDAEHLARIRPLAAEWHKSDEGRVWHRDHAKRLWDAAEPVTMPNPCEHCGGEIVTVFPGRGPVFCSRACAQASYRASHRYDVRVGCPICGEEFWQNKHKAEPKTCSVACGSKLAWQTRRG